MGRCILKLTDDNGSDFYMEWSTVVDAPTTYGMPLEEFRDYYREEYGESGMRDLPARLERCERNGGASWINGFRDGADSTIAGNRAGPDETELTMVEIIERFCHSKNTGESNMDAFDAADYYTTG